MKRIFSVLLLAAAMVTDVFGGSMPKLVVGIVVDQMRWDYLKYYDYTFGDNGFRRLTGEGYNCDNCLINYVPTVTAVGHTCIYTGSLPAITGIAGNNFFIDGKEVYCTDDKTVQTVGSNTTAGLMSPRNLRVTTMGDAVKMAQGFKSKTIGISLKDRGAILPAGHSADAAYWYDKDAGVFISSTYYMKELPEWVKKFNKENRQTTDIRYTPMGNEMVKRMAIATINGEKLGQGNTTDFLAVSFSSTDYIGHKYGTRAKETEEVYRQLDGQIEALLSELDAKVGKGNYMVFLSADHAAAHNHLEMQAQKIPAGIWIEQDAVEDMNNFLAKEFGTTEKLVKSLTEYRIYLDKEAIARIGKDICSVKKALIGHLVEDDRIAYAVDFENVSSQSIPSEIRGRIIRGYNPKRSGDILVILQPGYYSFYLNSSYEHGTTHGAWYPYDSHIPLIFYGWNIPKGSNPREVHITDIAATVCSVLGIQVPDGCVGQPIIMK